MSGVARPEPGTTPDAGITLLPRPWPRRHAALLVLALLLLCVVAGLVALVSTTAGARLALRLADDPGGARIEAVGVEGRLLGPLRIERLHYRNDAAGVELRVAELKLELRATALLRARLHINSLALQDLELTLTEPTRPASDAPPSLDPPVDLQIDRLTLQDGTIRRDGALLLRIRTAAAAAHWTDAGLDITHFDLVAPEGEVHLGGEVDADAGRYRGQGRGHFRWQAGGRQIAGMIRADAADERAELELRLTAPLVATLQLGLQQREGLPWTFRLDVPRFDPREQLLPDTAVQALALQLNGSGSLRGGTAEGTAQIDGERITVRPLQLTRRGEDWAIDAQLQGSAGALHVNGTLQTAATPLAGRFALDWRNVELPSTLTRQRLQSTGTAQVEGSLDRYVARADFNAGPIGRPADFTLNLSGSLTGIDLQRLEIRQPAGRFSASGRLEFAPTLHWRLAAEGRDFDPGLLLAGWPGRLDFKLASEGLWNGVERSRATLRLDALRGHLRGRPVSGDADLQLSPGLGLAGSLDLRSAASRIRIEAKRGSNLDAVTRIDIPTLNDWLPDAIGRIEARMVASGRWPALRITGEALVWELHYGGQSLRNARLDFDLSDPRDIRGSARLVAKALKTTAVEISSLELRADGDSTSHQLVLDAAGKRASGRLRLQGGIAQGTWQGTLEELQVEVRDAASLRLQAPVQLLAAAARFEMSQACLADGDIRLCVAGRGRRDGALEANYSVEHLPLELTAALSPAPWPVLPNGRLDGRGQLRRNAAGVLTGEAQLNSTGGSLALAASNAAADAGTAGTSKLLDFADLRITAKLSGDEAHGTLVTRIDETGRVDASLAVAGLGAASTLLDGRLRADLGSLAVIDGFVTQLVNVDGRLRVDASLSGTLDAPLLRGQLEASSLVADVPELGLQLREGTLRVTPQDDGRFLVAGTLRSGEGRLRFDGSALADGSGQLDLLGSRFLAVDRPAARVLIAPELRLRRSNAGRIDVDGSIAIPRAQIDLQRLPRGDRPRTASPDVVVVDDIDPPDQIDRELPLFANVELRLGDEVSLSGFGLDATVAGTLQLNERPGAATSAAGDIRVAGTYKAYGQDLTIRRGQLLYAATPLDDPRLNIVAVRVVGDVTSGLRVTGRAQSPQLDVFSDPAMGQANALAWLVTGKPLEDLRQSGAENDALASAARSLGTAAGGLLARNVGRRLGIDELDIKDSAALGGAALSVGQYLSPRVFLSYGVGLFKPGEVLTLRYRLSDSLAIEAQSATDSSRAGIEYRIEK